MVENILTTLPGLTLDRSADLPLHAQLAQALRAAVEPDPRMLGIPSTKDAL